MGVVTLGGAGVMVRRGCGVRRDSGGVARQGVSQARDGMSGCRRTAWCVGPWGRPRETARPTGAPRRRLFRSPTRRRPRQRPPRHPPVKALPPSRPTWRTPPASRPARRRSPACGAVWRRHLARRPARRGSPARRVGWGGWRMRGRRRWWRTPTGRCWCWGDRARGRPAPWSRRSPVGSPKGSIRSGSWSSPSAGGAPPTCGTVSRRGSPPMGSGCCASRWCGLFLRTPSGCCGVRRPSGVSRRRGCSPAPSRI